MPRIIISNESKPCKIEAGGKKIWICQCGLSKNKPFCDGSHTRTFEEKSNETYYYTSLTQKRINLPGIDVGSLESRIEKKEEIIFRSDTHQVFRLSSASDRYAEVIDIREPYLKDRAIDAFDKWSDLYLLQKNGHFCATFRVTKAQEGELDVEGHYPDFLQDPLLRKYIGSTNRLFKIRGSDCTTADLFSFFREACRDQYQEGIRLDLVNATLPMVRYYRTLGYQAVGEVFVHPETEKTSQAMINLMSFFQNGKLNNSLKNVYQKDHTAKLEFEYLKKTLKTM